LSNTSCSRAFLSSFTSVFSCYLLTAYNYIFLACDSKSITSLCTFYNSTFFFNSLTFFFSASNPFLALFNIWVSMFLFYWMCFLLIWSYCSSCCWSVSLIRFLFLSFSFLRRSSSSR
jgi:hypothetical protein